MTIETAYQALVEKIFNTGPHGPYAVARNDVLHSVTFSLTPDVWQEKDYPDAGLYVILSQIRRTRAGWRAKSARYLTPSDEQQAAITPPTSKEQLA